MRTRTELDALVGDLPGDVGRSHQVDRRGHKRFTGVAFGSVERRGRRRLPRRAGLAVVFGDADIDLRGAELDGPVVTITALLLFGNADFYVPTGADIDLGGRPRVPRSSASTSTRCLARATSGTSRARRAGRLAS